MTPETVKILFDANAIVIMFVWGLLHKYLPQLAKLPNHAIPWVNLVGYILARFAIPNEAHAASGAVAAIPEAVGVIIGGFTNAVWARQFYEGFARSLLEQVLGLRKAMPNGGIPPEPRR